MNAQTFLDHLIDAQIPTPAEVARHRSMLDHWSKIRTSRQGLDVKRSEEPCTNPGNESDEGFYRRLTNAVCALTSPFVVEAASLDFPQMADALATVPVGVLPVRTTNAQVMVSPSGQPLVIVDAGLVSILSFFLEPALYAPVLRKTSPEGASLLLDTACRFVAAYYDCGCNLEFPYPVEIPRGFAEAGQLFELSIKAFVIAHEFAHICAGHLGSFDRVQGVWVAPSSTPRLDSAVSQEFEADDLAWKWYQRAANRLPFLGGLSPEYRCIAPLYLFAVMHVVYSNVAGYRAIDTHPAPLDRLQRLAGQIMDAQSRKIALELHAECSAMKRLPRFRGASSIEIKNECELLFALALGTGRAILSDESRSHDPHAESVAEREPAGVAGARVTRNVKEPGKALEQVDFYYSRDAIADFLRRWIESSQQGCSRCTWSEEDRLSAIGIDEHGWRALMIETDDRFGLNVFWLDTDPSWILLRSDAQLKTVIEYLWRRILLELDKPFPPPHPRSFLEAAIP